MTVEPQGSVYLCKTPLENDYKNQLTFANATAQLTYFNSTIQKTYTNYTYIRKDNKVVVGDNIDSIINCNYLFYKNTGFTTKYYFCFITDMKFLNENATEITFETDCFQTWQFDIIYKRCFVEREHVNDDTIGLHTVPEGLEYGDYIEHTVTRTNWGTMWYLINVTKYWHNPDNTPPCTNLGNYFVAGAFYLCKTVVEVITTIGEYNDPSNNVSSDNIVSVYMIPEDFFYTTTVGSHLEWDGQSYQMNNTQAIPKFNSLNGYYPKNNKLYCYPYCAILLSNNAGTSNTLRPEEFSSNPIDNTKNLFEVKTLPSVGGSCKCSPMYYKNHGSQGYEEEGITAGKFPTLSWSQDAYTNWLTQNGVNISVGIASNIGMSIGGAIAGDVGTSLTGVSEILKTVAQIEQQKTAPDSARGNVNGGDVQAATSSNRIYFYNLCIKSEYAAIIDNFFSMFGYKINRVKIPNRTGRSNWNYVKTIDANMEGDIPQKDLNIIKTMFNNGVTLWHSASTMYDYSQTNSIV